MDIAELIETTLKEILERIGTEYTKIEVSEPEGNSYYINIYSDSPSLLIGHHGENIQAIQHLLKVLTWRKSKQENFFINLDIEDYRKRQQENAMNLAERKVSMARKTGRPQKLPPMSPALRRKIHLHMMNPEFDDVETFSEGEKDRRRIVIKLKN